MDKTLGPGDGPALTCVMLCAPLTKGTPLLPCKDHMAVVICRRTIFSARCRCICSMG